MTGRSSCLCWEQASRCFQILLEGTVRWIRLQIKWTFTAGNGYGVNKQVLCFWVQHVNVFSVECRICHVRFTAPLWSALTLIYRAWIEDLCVGFIGKSKSRTAASQFKGCFSVHRWVLDWLHGQICQNRLGIRYENMCLCVARACLVVMLRNSLLMLTSLNHSLVPACVSYHLHTE